MREHVRWHHSLFCLFSLVPVHKRHLSSKIKTTKRRHRALVRHRLEEELCYNDLAASFRFSDASGFVSQSAISIRSTKNGPVSLSACRKTVCSCPRCVSWLRRHRSNCRNRIWICWVDSMAMVPVRSWVHAIHTHTRCNMCNKHT